MNCADCVPSMRQHAEGDLERARGHLATARALVAKTGYHRRDEEVAELEARLRAA